MAPSQLKQLKASLREGGLVGPQQPKKQKKKAAQGGRDPDKSAKRNAALQGIREKFNPFESKAPSRPNKFEVTSRNSINGTSSKVIQDRPGVTKGLGEERRRRTLLKEIHSRNKTGGILDRRFGENDPTMTPDERVAERFARESQRRSKKGSLFNLEDDKGELELTHLGRSLTFDPSPTEEDEDGLRDDFDGLNDEDNSEDEHRKRKRRRISPLDEDGEAESDVEDVLERPKSKNEAMKEVIAKSKLYKYERQKAKEDDDDLRAELDTGLAEIYDLIGGRKPAIIPASAPKQEASMQMNPDRAALLNGKHRKKVDREYDERLRQMTFDKRSQPAERTKTEEEKAEEEAERLRVLEADRHRRMRGEPESDSDRDGGPDQLDMDHESIHDDAEEFGLATPNGDSRPELGVEDEDDFILDDELIASDSEADHVLIDGELNSSEHHAGDDDDVEFLGDLSLPNVGNDETRNRSGGLYQVGPDSGMAFTYPCPQSHEELLQITKNFPITNLPTVIQRIRVLYHPKLSSSNKSKMEIFCEVLTEHVAYLANQPSRPPFDILESLLRHIHSLAKNYPESVGRAFRSRLKSAGDQRPLILNAGDLIILTGVGFIFPTSDHFHQVVTPSMLTMARYLGQSVVHSLSDLATGAYLCSLCLQYLSISRRYIPEAMTYVLNALEMLAPVQPSNWIGHASQREPSQSLRISGAVPPTARALSFWDISVGQNRLDEDEESLKGALVGKFARLLEAAATLWQDKSAFYEIFAPAKEILRNYLIKPCVEKLPKTMQQSLQSVLEKIDALLANAVLRRRPLLLHNHRPLAIKTSIPKFEESFNPDRHYDPDRQRAESSKLKAEHKRERKGAMRELKKDANFIARESLKEKKAKDVEYEKKYRRLVSEINAEEGREANDYERERTMRKRKR